MKKMAMQFPVFGHADSEVKLGVQYTLNQEIH